MAGDVSIIAANSRLPRFRSNRDRFDSKTKISAVFMRSRNRANTYARTKRRKTSAPVHRLQ